MPLSNYRLVRLGDELTLPPAFMYYSHEAGGARARRQRGLVARNTTAMAVEIAIASSGQVLINDRRVLDLCAVAAVSAKQPFLS